MFLSKGMLKTGDIRDSSFEWLRVLKYHMDVRNVLRAKTESVEIAMQAQLHTSRKPAKSRRASQPAKSRTEQSLGNYQQALSVLFE